MDSKRRNSTFSPELVDIINWQRADMKNDLWYLGNGNWVAYSEDCDTIAVFKGLKEMQLTATYYHYRKGGIRAAQFKFHQGKDLSRGKCLLQHVCSLMHFDFRKALALYRNNDSTPYTEKYPKEAYQLELFQESPGPWEKTKKNKRGK
jgi:hypothetical protein